MKLSKCSLLQTFSYFRYSNHAEWRTDDSERTVDGNEGDEGSFESRGTAYDREDVRHDISNGNKCEYLDPHVEYRLTVLVELDTKNIGCEDSKEVTDLSHDLFLESVPLDIDGRPFYHFIYYY